jgi:N12 class adenine-specific DNA methylase
MPYWKGLTLDSQTRMHRKWLNAHAEMLGAIRLPRNTFKKQANTDVVTDIVIMRKRERPVFDAEAVWVELGTAPDHLLLPGQILTDYNRNAGGYRDKPRAINAYFEKNPGMVIGLLEFRSTQYGHEELVPRFDGDEQKFADRLSDCVNALPADVYKEPVTQQVDFVPSIVLERVVATREEKPGSFVLHNGAIHISEGTDWVEVDAAYKGITRERLVGLIRIKEAARALLEQQATSTDDAAFKQLQMRLNTVYDSFIVKYSNVSDSANTRVFRTDPECPLVLSLESYDEEAEVYRKADIFTKRTVGRREAPVAADNCQDALLISLAVYGRIVVADMARRLKMKSKDVIQSLIDESLAYQDPEDGLWKPADEYLSGHIRNKIATASAGGKQFLRNVSALTAVLPKDLGPAEVEVRLGAPWVPIDVLDQFVCELIGAKPGSAEVVYDGTSATWSVKTLGRQEWAGDRLLNTGTWGTADRCAVELMEAAMNQTPPKITRTAPDKK